MEILRDGFPSIIKNEINLENLQPYNQDQIKEAKYLLKDTIENYPISTLEMITILRERYEDSLINTYNSLKYFSDYDRVRYNCYYLSKVLHNKLLNIGIKSYFMTHKAHFFALSSGDEKMKEAHISLLYPSLKDGKVLYTIFDPGLKVDIPLSFYKNSEIATINNNGLLIDIKKTDNDLYPYCINLNGINPYSYNMYPHSVMQAFNPKYETINLDELAYPISYRLLTGYKATIFAKEQEKRAYITLNHLSKTLETFDGNTMDNYSFKELNQMGGIKLKDRLNNMCSKLSLDVDEIVNNVFFVINVIDEFNTQLMDHDVVNEYNKIKVKK